MIHLGGGDALHQAPGGFVAEADLTDLAGSHHFIEGIEGLLDSARRGESGVVVFHGDAGMGKTALLDYAAESAGALAIVRVVGTEAEQSSSLPPCTAFFCRSSAGSINFRDSAALRALIRLLASLDASRVSTETLNKSAFARDPRANDRKLGVMSGYRR